jgi:hypothetical protein
MSVISQIILVHYREDVFSWRIVVLHAPRVFGEQSFLNSADDDLQRRCDILAEGNVTPRHLHVLKNQYHHF